MGMFYVVDFPTIFRHSTYIFIYTSGRNYKQEGEYQTWWNDWQGGGGDGGEGKSILYYELPLPDARPGAASPPSYTITGCCLYIIRNRSVTEDSPSVNGRDFPNPIMCANLIRRCCSADCYSETLFYSRYRRVSKWKKFSVKLFLTEITCR